MSDVEDSAGSNGDADYWRQRERAARVLAEQAADAQIARLHLAMAERYALMARDAALPERPR